MGAAGYVWGCGGGVCVSVGAEGYGWDGEEMGEEGEGRRKGREVKGKKT